MGSCLTHLHWMILSWRADSLYAQLMEAVKADDVDELYLRERIIAVYGIYIDYLACEERVYWESPRLRNWIRIKRRIATRVRNTYIEAALDEQQQDAQGIESFLWQAVANLKF